MAFYNKVILVGRLTADPEPARKVGMTGKFVVSFRFAVGRSKKNPQTGQWENDPNPLYIDCDSWIQEDGRGVGKIIADYARKGSEMMIDGRLQFEMWDDKNNPGQKRSKHKVVVDNVQLLSKAAGNDGASSQPARPAQNTYSGGGYMPDEPPGGDDDIPF